jgi:hypothetical protein
MARHSGDTKAELRAHGVLGAALQGMGRLDEAERSFRAGLDEAHAQGDQREVASFLMDFAMLHVERAQPAEAYDAFRTAAQLFESLHDLERAASCTASALAVAAGASRRDDVAGVFLWLVLQCEQGGAGMWRHHLASVVDVAKAAVTGPDADPTIVHIMLAICVKLVEEHEDQVTDHLKLLADVLITIVWALERDAETAGARGRALDEVTGGALGLEAFVASLPDRPRPDRPPPPPEGTVRRLLGRLRGGR